MRWRHRAESSADFVSAASAARSHACTRIVGESVEITAGVVNRSLRDHLLMPSAVRSNSSRPPRKKHSRFAPAIAQPSNPSDSKLRPECRSSHALTGKPFSQFVIREKRYPEKNNRCDMETNKTCLPFQGANMVGAATVNAMNIPIPNSLVELGAESEIVP